MLCYVALIKARLQTNTFKLLFLKITKKICLDPKPHLEERVAVVMVTNSDRLIISQSHEHQTD